MTTFRCTIHNIEFGATGMDSFMILCPKCSLSDNQDLVRKLEEVIEHRDTLLRAIEIKRTVIPAKEGGAV